MWRIEGFSSADPPPPQDIAPTPQNVSPNTYEEPGRLTRSAFVPVISPQCPAQFTRIVEFHTPKCGVQFFMRFKLHFVPGQNPVLAFCNAGGEIFFWDFKRLAIYHDIMDAMNDPGRDSAKPLRLPSWLKPVQPRPRTDAMGRVKGVSSDKDSVTSAQTGHSESSGYKAKDGATEFSAETLESWASRYSLEDPADPLKAHKTESSSANFVGRQAAWSPGGEWCVIVGSSNTALVLQRWSKRGPGHATPDP